MELLDRGAGKQGIELVYEEEKVARKRHGAQTGYRGLVLGNYRQQLVVSSFSTAANCTSPFLTVFNRTSSLLDAVGQENEPECFFQQSVLNSLRKLNDFKGHYRQLSHSVSILCPSFPGSTGD